MADGLGLGTQHLLLQVAVVQSRGVAEARGYNWLWKVGEVLVEADPRPSGGPACRDTELSRRDLRRGETDSVHLGAEHEGLEEADQGEVV